MAFDATKLVVGKKYKRRDGMVVEFMRQFQNCNHHMRLLSMITFSDGTQMPVTNEIDGRSNADGTHPDGDIISDEPIKEPVEIAVPFRFAVFDRDGGFCGHWPTMQRALTEAAMIGNAIGVYELPEKILVTPR